MQNLSLVFFIPIVIHVKITVPTYFMSGIPLICGCTANIAFTVLNRICLATSTIDKKDFYYYTCTNNYYFFYFLTHLCNPIKLKIIAILIPNKIPVINRLLLLLNLPFCCLMPSKINGNEKITAMKNAKSGNLLFM